MATRAASKRLAKESQMMDKDPPPYCYARPREDNVLEWHFILRGPPDTPFHGGEFWGQLLFPPEYPFKPPGIKVSTPSGRFHTDTKICTSMSDFHPGSWNPAWSVANILVGLLSFMCSDEMTTGSVMATPSDRQALARVSHAYNIKQTRFKRIFPDYCSQMIRDLPNMGEKPKAEINSLTSESSTGPPSRTHPPETTSAKTNHISGVRRRHETQDPTQTQSASASGSIDKAPQQIEQQPQARPRAIYPILLVLAAYLFLSRLLSILGSGGANVAS